MERDIAFQPYTIVSDDQGDFENFRNAMVGLEILGFLVMVLQITYMKKTIKVFGRNEFDLIRNNFITSNQDLYTKVQENSYDV
jgi:hypothetical protein